MLAEVAAKQRSPRVLISIAGGDHLHPHEVRGPKIRTALQKQGGTFVLLDEAMPIKGHGAAATWQFTEWYGPRIRNFVDLTKSPQRPKTTCPAPTPAPTFLMPANFTITAPAYDLPAVLARCSGSRFGRFSNEKYISQDRGFLLRSSASRPTARMSSMPSALGLHKTSA